MGERSRSGNVSCVEKRRQRRVVTAFRTSLNEAIPPPGEANPSPVNSRLLRLLQTGKRGVILHNASISWTLSASTRERTLSTACHVLGNWLSSSAYGDASGSGGNWTTWKVDTRSGKAKVRLTMRGSRRSTSTMAVDICWFGSGARNWAETKEEA